MHEGPVSYLGSWSIPGCECYVRCRRLFRRRSIVSPATDDPSRLDRTVVRILSNASVFYIDPIKCAPSFQYSIVLLKVDNIVPVLRVRYHFCITPAEFLPIKRSWYGPDGGWCPAATRRLGLRGNVFPENVFKYSYRTNWTPTDHRRLQGATRRRIFAFVKRISSACD